MKCGIKLTVDYAFKRTFGTEENRNVLMHLLNSILAQSLSAPIAEITVLNPFSGKDTAADKLTIFDIKARDELGREFIIEVQLYDHENLRERLVYYWAKEYAAQLREGDDYDVLKPVYVICITEATLFREAAKAHSRFQLIDASQNLPLTSHLEVHVIELQKFLLSLEELEDDEDLWLYFLRNSEDYDSESLPKSLAAVPEIRQATGTLTMVAHTPTEREIYEANLKALRDERSRLKTAINQGRAIGFVEGRIEGRTEGRVEGLIEGRLEGLLEGQIAESRTMLLKLGQLQMGPLTPQQRQRIDSIADYETLQRCVVLLHPSRNWDEVLNEVTATAADN